MNWENLSEIVNPWQALVILGILLVPQVLAYLQSRQSTRILKHEIKPNAGKTLKDSLNRIEETLVKHGELLKEMDERVDRVEKIVDYLHPQETDRKPRTFRRRRS